MTTSIAEQNLLALNATIEAIQADTKGSVQAIATISSIINQIHDLSEAISAAVEEEMTTTGEIARSISEGGGESVDRVRQKYIGSGAGRAEHVDRSA